MARIPRGEAAEMTQDAAAKLNGVSHHYGATVALDHVTLTIPSGCMAGLIGPDGVGKSTLLALVAGVRRIQTGKVIALGGDMKDARHRQASIPRIAICRRDWGAISTRP